MMRAETKEVQESIVMIQDDRGTLCEVHLIDTPGFDDDFDADTTVLDKIANWTNSLFHCGNKISGVLYLHDVSLPRMRGSGVRNLQMLPEFIGKEKLQFLTLVTTHWGTLRDSDKEVQNEESLMADDQYWKTLLEGDSRANTRRFDNTTGSALEIIREHLQHKFVTCLTREMVTDSRALGETSAGKIVHKNLTVTYRQALKDAGRDGGAIAALEQRLALVKQRLQHKFDKERDLALQQRLKHMKSKQRIFRAVRWVVRAGAVAGVTTAIVISGGAASPLLASLPVVEAWAQVWSAYDKEKRNMAMANHEAAHDRELADFYSKEELEDEDIAVMNFQ